MVGIGLLNIAVGFDNGRAQVFVTLDNKQVIASVEFSQHTALVQEQVVASAATAKVGPNFIVEGIKATEDFTWDLPVGWRVATADIHPRVKLVVLFGDTGEFDLDHQVTAEPGQCWSGISGSVGRHRAELEP